MSAARLHQRAKAKAAKTVAQKRAAKARKAANKTRGNPVVRKGAPKRLAPAPKPDKRQIADYHHNKTRRNPPAVGLAAAETGPEKIKTYRMDSHLPPLLQLSWAERERRRTMSIPTLSLHVHERIEPRAIIRAVRSNGNGQPPLFEAPSENLPPQEAIQFYQHDTQWSNRLIAGDSLLVMNSLLEKEKYGGKVQCVYMDPPYGIKYGSNFQPFVNKREVRDGKAEDLTSEPEVLKAFRDTWQNEIHSYLPYLCDRLFLARKMLAETGSCFVQIGEENVHLVRCLMDDIFGVENFVSVITFRTKTGRLSDSIMANVSDYLIWYAKAKGSMKSRKVYLAKEVEGDAVWSSVQLPNGKRRKMTKAERGDHSLLPGGARVYRLRSLAPVGYNPNATFSVEFEGKIYGPPGPPGRRSWCTNKEGVERLKAAGRIEAVGEHLEYVFYFDDFPHTAISNNWADTRGASDKRFVVQTANEIVQRCLMLTTDAGDLVFDPTCGSGTTAHVAEQWGRRWITCDTSRVALTLARQRLMTATYEYYRLVDEGKGISGGFDHKTVPHVTLKSLARGKPAEEETLADVPKKDSAKARVTGPFTVEAVPAPVVRSPEELIRGPKKNKEADDALPAGAEAARRGETLRHSEWRDELMQSGIRGKGGGKIMFSWVESCAGSPILNLKFETKGANPKRGFVSFGPEHAPLSQWQVERARKEAARRSLDSELLVFAAFEFDPEAARTLDELEWPGVTVLKVKMNADLQTADLKKQSDGEPFWLMGRPDVGLRRLQSGKDRGKWVVKVRGFDYYDPRTGKIESRDADKHIAAWMLDANYDERQVFPSQVFFPMADKIYPPKGGRGGKRADGWTPLALALKAEVDPEKIEAFHGTESLPFELGGRRLVAVKIVDDRGIESLRVLDPERR